VRSLTICLGQEPTSLYPIDNTSPAAQAVLAAIYEGPITTNSYGSQPVILTRLPSLENGDVHLSTTEVSTGEEVVDAQGTPVTLAPGVRVRPAGCRSADCAVPFDGSTPLQMDQMIVIFRLLPGLRWSDGQPLSAADSVFAFQLDQAGYPSFRAASTRSYTAIDDLTLQWQGKPGFIDPGYLSDFWPPLPAHLWSSLPATELKISPQASRSPVGWGPYQIENWAAGEAITLTRNPYYFRAPQGLPKFDQLIFRFTPDPQAALNDLETGRCDILDSSVPLDGQAAALTALAQQGKLQALFSTTPVMEQLAFGLDPAAYDSGSTSQPGHPAYFSDVRVRQAVALCTDRQTLINTILGGMSSVPDGYIPAGSPLHASGLTEYGYDPSAGEALLEAAGWRLSASDPSGPRLAEGIQGIKDGTPLELNYITTSAAERTLVSTQIAKSLAQCGFQVSLQYLDQDTLYAAGPGGPLFGRQFDLAEFAMAPATSTPECGWFASSEIPSAADAWIGANVSGFSDPAFDAACQTASQSLPEEAAYAAAYATTQSIFAEQLPVLPLYWRIKVAAAREGICGFSLDPTAATDLDGIAGVGSGTDCSPATSP
jgi:peptide/nickel transport system substrate-binding protein